jgi:division protein CdvB (Snf7/Vps24/ESCRT-III family)
MLRSMTDEKTVTLWYISESTDELVEMDVPADVAEATHRGETVSGRWAQRRFKREEAEDRLQARLDELRGRSKVEIRAEPFPPQD